MQIKTIAITPEQKNAVNNLIESVRNYYSSKDGLTNNKLNLKGKQNLEVIRLSREHVRNIIGRSECDIIEDLARQSTEYPLTPEEIYSIFTSITKVKIEEVTA